MQEERLVLLRKEYEIIGQMVKFLTETSDDKLSTEMAQVSLDGYKRIIECAEQGKPFIYSVYACAPEILNAMDLPWYTFFELPFTGALLPNLQQDIEGSDRLFGNDLCTLMRVSAYYIEKDMLPLPTAMIGLIHPCDGITMLHQVVAANENWRNVPIFAADPPYFQDDRSLDYYTGELRRMVSFLEKHTGRRLDMDRLREVVRENNKQMELWAEYNDLRRAIPCPHGFGIGTQLNGTANSYTVGDPRATAWFKGMVADAERLVREGKGKVPKERIRLLWFDVASLELSFDLFPWLEQEWGAVVVMDMFGYCPYTPIDTSNEDAMLRGLAKKALVDVPMIRQGRGVADNFVSDITRVVKDYKIDCVIWPGHMGHKESAAAVGIMRETCRDIGVPFLHIGMDLFNKNYTPMQDIKTKCSQFFTTMGLGQVKVES